MIIDFHTHAFTESVAEKAISNLSKTSGIVPLTDGTVKNLIEFMNDEGVDKSVILPVLFSVCQDFVQSPEYLFPYFVFPAPDYSGSPEFPASFLL